MGNREPHISNAGQVKILQANLDERYREMFCITQELLQNADDAEAKNVLIGKFNGISRFHSLTSVPGLIYLNDGPVSENDLDQIFSIADSNKNADTVKIGKFGLGMKSVFHICETFMIFGGQKDRQIAEFFDPWRGEWEDHKKWKNSFDAQETALWTDFKDKIKTETQDWPQWFGIWLPLRKREHCEYAGHLFDCYPSPQEVLEQYNPANCLRIAQMFPFMKHVKNIRFCGDLKHVSPLQINAERRFSLTAGRLDGIIHAGSQEMRFVGCEKHSRDEKLNLLKHDPDWPKISDNSSGRAKMIPEKAAPHVAIAVLKRKTIMQKELPSLTIRYAAYLPLTDDTMCETYSLASECPYHITLHLHAHFFIDAGRRKFDLENAENPNSIKIRWNKRILNYVLLPGVIAELDLAFTRGQWSEEKIAALINGIKDTKFYRDNSEHLTREHAFYQVLTRDGWKWKLFPATGTYWEVPGNADDFLRQPVINAMPETAVLVNRNAGRLTTKEPEKWNEHQAGQLLAGLLQLEEHRRYSETTLKFLIDFANYNSSLDIEFIKKFFKDISFPVYNRLKNLIGRLLLQKCHLFRPVYFAESNWDTRSFMLWKDIALAARDVLPMILDSSVDYESAKWQPYSRADLTAMLPIMEKHLPEATGNEKSLLRDLVCELGQYAVAEIDLRESFFGDRNLFFPDQETFPVSLNVMLGGHTFANGGRQELLKHLGAALVDFRYFILSSYSEIMKRANFRLVAFSDDECRKILAQKPVLNQDLSARLRLLKAIKEKAGENILRYLLHGDPAQYDSSEELWVSGTGMNAGTDTWRNLLNILQRRTAKIISSIEPILLDALTESEQREAQIVKLSPDEILRRMGVAAHSENDFAAWRTDRTWKYVLEEIHQDDPNIRDAVRALPIYPIQQGRFTAYDLNCYLEESVAIEDIFLDTVKRLIPDKDPRLRQKQMQLFDHQIWNTESCLKYCSQRDWCDQLAPIILDAIQILSEENKELSSSERTYLQSVPFLTDINGRRVKPVDILPFKKLFMEAQELGIYFWEQIDQSSFSETAKDFINTKILWSVPEALKRLDEILDLFEDYHGGKWELLPDDYTPEIFIEIFSGEPNMRLVKIIQDLNEQQIDASPLLRIKRSIPTTRMIHLCNSLGRKIENDLGNGMLQAYYLDLLRQAASDPTFHVHILPNLCLPNEWLKLKKASELGYCADNVNPEFLLHAELRKLISPSVPGTVDIPQSEFPVFASSANLSKKDFEEKINACWSELEIYFKDWPENLYPLIGAFLILTDNSIHIKSNVEKRFLAERPESLRLQIASDFEEKQKDTLLHIDIFSGKYCAIRSLTGSWLRVPLEDNIKNLLVGDDSYSCRLHYHQEARTNAIYLALRKINPSQYSQEELSLLLKNTTQRVLEKMRINTSALDDCWDTLQKTGQFALETTQKLILEDLLFSLQALGLNQNGNLKTLLSEWKKLRTDKKDAERQCQIDIIKTIDCEIRVKQNELEELFNCPEVQREVLTAIRKRISKHFGYDFNSVVLELLQNADDASVELEVMMGDQYSADIPHEFFIQYTNESLNVIHWGRAINKYNGYGFDRGLELGFRNDLEKMLQFLQSDKEDGGMKRTGKFGLGFKSVFLLSDSPLVGSGELQFRILGGLLPEEAQADDKQLLKGIQYSMEPNFPKADGLPKPTVFHLPYRPDLETRPDMETVLRIMPLLVCFSKKINRIVIFENLNRRSEIRKEKNQKFYFTTEHAIFTLPPDTTLVLGYDLGVFSPMPADIPTVWVTVPTKENLNLGFVINSNFEIDVGRTHLIDSSSHNRELMSQAGLQFYSILEEEILPNANLLPSLWRVFQASCAQIAEMNTVGAQLAKSVIWGEDNRPNGYGRLIFEHPALPTGLPAPFDSPCCAKDIQYIADETLTAIWHDLTPWLKTVEPGTIVAESVGCDLKKIKIYPKSWPSLTMIQILRDRVADDDMLRPDDLKGIPWTNVLPRLKESKQWPDICKEFQRFQFCCQSNLFFPCMNLLLADNTENYDEQKRAKFAPDDTVLSYSYDPDAKALFLAIRGQLNAPAERLAEWALNAKSTEARQGVLEYLLCGDLGRSMASELLKIGISASWLKELSPSNPMGLDVNDLAIVLGHLHGYPEAAEETSVAPEDEYGLWLESELSDCNYLESVYEWWSINHQAEQERYNNKVYGRNSVKTLRLADDDSLTIEERMEWMELLVLGAAHTLGRTTMEQHKGFIQFLRDRNYWDTFCDNNIDTQKWLDVLDDFIDKEHLREEFGNWMRLYIRIYQFSKYLNDYITIFSWWNSDEMPISREDLCRFRNNQRYAGTIAPPDLFKALGNVGLHFVYREMIRRGTIENKHLHRYCFVPYRNIRDAFGSDSSRIYETIQEHIGTDRATFLNAFDIAIFSYKKHRMI